MIHDIVDTQTQLLNLISLIYETVERPEVWNEFLEQFATAVHGTVTPMLLFSPENAFGSVTAAARFDPAEQRRYADYYASTDQWAIRGIPLLVPGTVVVGNSLCPEKELERSEFYADFCRPLNIHHQFCGVIARHGDTTSTLTSTRPRTAEPFGAEEIRLMQALVPHLQRARSLHSRLGQLEASCRWQAEVLDRLCFGVAMLSALGGVLWMNAIAHSIIAKQDGLRADPDGLAADKSAESRRLRHLVFRATQAGIGKGLHSGGFCSISRASGRRPLRLLISPFRSQDDAAVDGQRPSASVFIFDPETEPEDINSKLMRVHAFTAGEARVAALLLRGLTISEASQRLGIARSTARNVVKRLFAKTNTNRQADFIRELLVGPVQIGGPLY